MINSIIIKIQNVHFKNLEMRKFSNIKSNIRHAIILLL